MAKREFNVTLNGTGSYAAGLFMTAHGDGITTGISAPDRSRTRTASAG